MSFLHDWKKATDKELNDYLEALKEKDYKEMRRLQNRIHNKNKQWRKIE